MIPYTPCRSVDHYGHDENGIISIEFLQIIQRMLPTKSRKHGVKAITFGMI